MYVVQCKVPSKRPCVSTSFENQWADFDAISAILKELFSSKVQTRETRRTEAEVENTNQRQLTDIRNATATFLVTIVFCLQSLQRYSAAIWRRLPATFFTFRRAARQQKLRDDRCALIGVSRLYRVRHGIQAQDVYRANRNSGNRRKYY